MAMPSSKTMNYTQLCDIVREKWMRSESEMVPELRPVMPVDLFIAAIKGNRDVLIPRLVNKEDSDSVKSELQSATLFGDTILHLLIAEKHNELALKVSQCDKSLLKARNNMLETPLCCAVKVGNTDIIDKLMENNYAVVKDVVVALHVAIIKGYTKMVQRMLDVNPNLACTPFPDGMFPVHEAARMGNLHLVMHFIQKYPVGAELRDPYGRNFFHIAAEENKEEFFNIAAIEKKYFEDKDDLNCRERPLQQWREMIERMITVQNYEGNTPFHIAAMEGNKKIMKAIWKQIFFEEMIEKIITAKNSEGNTPFHIAAMEGNREIMIDIWKHCKDAFSLKKTDKDAETGETQFELENKQGCTPLELSAKQVVKNNEDINKRTIKKYLETAEHYKFSEKWFNDFMEPPLENKWERTQVIGLGSVLITTVAFAAAFTMPGGYNQDHGTPVLGRKYMFRAFILANALAFIQGFLSLFALLSETLRGLSDDALVFASMSFLVAASSMVVAFGLGMYVTLAPVCLPIAILLLVITLILGTPVVIEVVAKLKSILGPTMNSKRTDGPIYIYLFYVMSFLLIFIVAFV